MESLPNRDLSERAEEYRKSFQRSVKWRAGSEDRIDYLNRGYGWDGARIDGSAIRPQSGEAAWMPLQIVGDEHVVEHHDLPILPRYDHGLALIRGAKLVKCRQLDLREI